AAELEMGLRAGDLVEELGAIVRVEPALRGVLRLVQQAGVLGDARGLAAQRRDAGLEAIAALVGAELEPRPAVAFETLAGAVVEPDVERDDAEDEEDAEREEDAGALGARATRPADEEAGGVSGVRRGNVEGLRAGWARRRRGLVGRHASEAARSGCPPLS